MNPVAEIKDRLNIVDVVSMYVTLVPAGKNFKGKSPFTNEKTPSFFVSPDKGLYHCFSTDKGGDIFTFVQEMEGLDFKGALHVLAERAGVKLERFEGGKKQSSEEKDVLYEIVEEATKFFESALSKSPEALEYLKNRGVTPETIQIFRIGLAPAGWRNLYEHLQGKFSDKDLLTVGLIKKADERLYDTFRDRIMFPICDSAGRPIAFSGRILHPDEKSAKYVNSPETPLFNKGSILFGLDKAKNSIRKNNFTIMAEGQFDVIMLHQAGFRNTVGISGTALSDTLIGANGVNNLGLVKRLSNNIVLALDSDGAGVRASKRSAHIAMSLGMDVKIAEIPSGKDPADFILSDGKEAWSKVLRDAKHLVEFGAHQALKSSKDERSLGRIINQEVLPDIAGLTSEIEKSFFIKKIAEITGLDENALWKDLDSIRTPEKLEDREIKKEERLSRTEKIERKLFALYFNNNEDKTIETLLRNIISPAKFEILLQKFIPIKDELVFETEVDGEESSNNPDPEMLLNLEEDYLHEQGELIKTGIKNAERGKDEEKAEALAKEHQALSKRLAEIRNSRHINKF